MPRKKAASADVSRLKVLAASDERAFLRLALELLASKDRLSREAAIAALAVSPLPEARPALRAAYADLDADGLKRDQGAGMRANVVRALQTIRDVRDIDIAIRASETREVAFGEDIAWQLRARGLALLADLAPDVFPYYAVEHLDDDAGIDGEPAHTAFRLLAATGNFAALYQWLLTPGREPSYVARVFELLSHGPPQVVRRYVARAVGDAAKRGDEALVTLLAEAIVNLELADSHPALAELMSSRISDELYGYLAVLLASTNRPPLLAVLERQLHRGRRPRAVEAALRVRTTPEQQAILERYERGEDLADDDG
jgi:hypothetical protein